LNVKVRPTARSAVDGIIVEFFDRLATRRRTGSDEGGTSVE